MTHEEILAKVGQLLCDILDDDSIQLSDLTTTDDIEEWDSTNHVRLIVAIEKEFDVHFETDEFASPRNVGELIDLVQSKMDRGTL